MAAKTSILAATLAVAAIAVSGGAYFLSSPQQKMTVKAPAPVQDFAVAAMPAGITLQPLGMSQGYGPQRVAVHARDEIVYSNENGFTVYTYDKDEAGKSNCTADCAKTWIPVTPIAGAEPVPGWTVIARDDGAKQWTRNGKPLYTFSGDKEPAQIGGGGVGSAGGGMSLGGIYGSAGPAPVPLAEGWHAAMFQTRGVPVAGIEPPFGIDVREVVDANGVILIDSRKMTLYAFDGDVNADKMVCATGASCPFRFVPLAAPQLADADGDWSFAKRQDGIKQWAYKGKPLYTYEGDLVVGDVRGNTIDKRFHTAALQRYFLPGNVTLHDNPGRGLVLATTDGRTLYRRDLDAFIPASHQVGHERMYRPRIGRLTRATACTGDCTKTWHPYLAPADAKPQGYWGVATLADGSKQWTYKDFALYTYAGDKKAGDMTGEDIFDITISTDPNKINDVGFPEHGPAGLYWTYAAL